MMVANFANSEGWKLVMPSDIQRRAPLTPLPMKGIYTNANSTSDNTNMGRAAFSQVSMGT